MAKLIKRIEDLDEIEFETIETKNQLKDSIKSGINFIESKRNFNITKDGVVTILPPKAYIREAINKPPYFQIRSIDYTEEALSSDVVAIIRNLKE